MKKLLVAAMLAMVGGAVLAAVAPYQLERDASDQTAMREGCSVFLRGHAGDFYKAMYCFDGNSGTHCDIWDNGNYDPIIGVDFGTRVFVSKVRFLPRQDNYEVNRLAGAAVYGCNDVESFPADQYASVDAFWAASTQVSKGTVPSGLASDGTWVELECDSSVAYRYLYVWDRADWQWFGNAAEIQFIGWTVDDVADSEPVDITAITVSALPNAQVSVAWECPGKVSTYRVERNEDGGTTWTVRGSFTEDSTEYANKEFVDDVAYNTAYKYRVVAVYADFDDEERVSEVKSLTYVDPAEFTVEPSDVENAYAVISWDASETFAGGAKIYRRVVGEGDWVVLDSVVEGVDTYTDETVIYGGLTYEYGLGLPAGSEVITKTASYIRLRRLDDFAGYVNLAFNHPGQSASLLFDGNEWTCGDIYQNGMGNPALGVSFDQKVFISKARILPRQDAGYISRAINVCVYGSNGDLNNETAFLSAPNAAQISYSGLPQGLQVGTWYDLACNSETPYRHIYLRRPDSDWYGNIAEVELYGWTEADKAALKPIEVTGVKAVSVSGEKIALSWECAGNVTKFVIERKAGGADWTTIGEYAKGSAVYAATAFDDDTVEYASAYVYRVSAVYEQFDTTLSAESASVVCFEPASLQVGASDEKKLYADLTWTTTDAFANGVVIYRRIGENGEWSAIAEVASGVTGYVDQAVKFGAGRYFYALGIKGGDQPVTEAVSYLKVRKLSWQSVFGFDYNHSGQSPELCFDGNIYTCMDAWNNDMGNATVGVDFGENSPVYVVLAHVTPRQDANYMGRLGGVTIFGNNNTEAMPDWQASTFADSSAFHQSGVEVARTRLPYPQSVNERYDIECDASTSYRYYYLRRPDGGAWYGNVAEVEFYGWTEKDLHGGFIMIIR